MAAAPQFLLLLGTWLASCAAALTASNFKARSANGIEWTLTWQLIADVGQRGAYQSHFQVQLSSVGLPDFDTGRVASQETSVHIPSHALAPHAVYKWRVRVWDERKRSSGWSHSHTLVTHPQTWNSPWITEIDAAQDVKTTLLRRQFSVTKPLSQAVVSVSGLGHYELTINSRRVGENQLDAGWTQYKATCLYSTYDVTELVRQGLNGMGVFLGNGMYNNVGTRYQKWTGSSGPRTLSLQMTLRFEDGTTQLVSTDTLWQGKQGPITFSSIYGGEDHDARLEVDGWDSPPFAGTGWSNASLHKGPGCSLQPQLQPPVKIREVLQAAQITEINRSKVVHFETEFSGWPVLSFQGRAGVTVRMTPSEHLAANGLVAQNIGPAYWQYTLKGGNVEFWRPKFFTYGFRYLQLDVVSDMDAHRNPSSPLPAFNVSGEFIYTSADIVGNFSCSKSLFNSIHGMIVGAMKSNLQSILTDCPHRERLGWLEQSWLLQSSIAANFDVSSLYAKMVRDMSEAQLSNGMIPDIAPEYVVFSQGYRDSPEWGIAFVMLPMFLHDEYGNIELLQQYYANMSRYMSYLERKTKNGILAYGLGDWTSIGDKSPLGVTATMVFYEGLQVMRRAAHLLRKGRDESYFAALANKTAAAYNAKWLDATSGGYVESQTATAMAVALGIAPDREKSMEWLVRSIERSGNHSLCGEIGWPYVVRSLSGAHDDLLNAIASRMDAPSYGYQITKGATTLTESWVADPGLSWNHAMDGHIDAWFYSHVAGIQSTKPLLLSPRPLPGIRFARASRTTKNGVVSLYWELADNFHVNVTVPPGEAALLTLPAAASEIKEGTRTVANSVFMTTSFGTEPGFAQLRIPSGMYVFEMPYTQKTAGADTYDTLVV